MKNKLKLLQARMFCVVALGIGWSFSLAAAAADSAGPVPAKTCIPWSQIGAKAGADYQGDGLAVSPTAGGARLRCAFQRLEGEATREGLWLTSTVIPPGGTGNERFHIVAEAVGRTSSISGEGMEKRQRTKRTAALQDLADHRGGTEQAPAFGVRQSSAALAAAGPCTVETIPNTGTVTIEGQTVRFTRPGLTEEYTVSMDGVRQDFIIKQRPVGEGPLRVELAVSGARVESAVGGARLVLENSGRKIAYSRLRVTDATGKELTARMKVMEDSESQRDSIAQPRVASPRATLGSRQERGDNPERVASDAPPRCDERCDATPLGLEINSRSTPRVARRTRNPALTDAIPSGSFASTTEWQAKTRSDDRAAMLLVLVNDAEAVYPVRIDPTFSDANWSSMGFPGANGEVDAAVVDGSGNLCIGGYFSLVGDVFANSIAKWDGSSWTALGSGINGAGINGYLYVSALAVSGGDVYAGGSFTTAGGSAATNIAKWDGSSWTALGSGMNEQVNALAVSGSDVYAGGQFTTAGGSAANSIAKWNGSSWSALGSGMNYSVLALAVSGSDLYAGGNFTTAGGSAATNIAKWDGSSWSALGSGMNGPNGGFLPYVNALVVSGGDLYAGGYFTSAGGSAANFIAKWEGSSWTALGSGIGGVVSALAVSGSDLYAGGQFATAGGSAANCVAKWDGSSWTALSSGMGGCGQDCSTVRALAVSGSDLYAGGDFTTAVGSTANNIAKWNGSSWSALGSGSGMDNRVDALAVSGSDVYAGGAFTTAGGSAANYIAKWDGTTWSALGSGMGGCGQDCSSVRALAVSGSDLYAGGDFTTAGGSAANYIAKWDGTTWSALGSGMDGNVYALAVSGSDLYAGGDFTTAGGTAVNYIAKWDGSSWSALGSGMSGGIYGTYVSALAVSGSNVYAGGDFTTAGGSAANFIAKWNGSSWSALGSGIGGVTYPQVYALAVSGSNVYAGGDFTTAGGSAATNIAKWDGSTWSALGSGMNFEVGALAVSGSDVYAGGNFRTAGGISANNIAKWDGSSWSALGSGMGAVWGGACECDISAVVALAVSGSDLYAGGNFPTAGGKMSAYIARAYLPTLPTLSVVRSGIPQGGITVSWPSVDTASFTLEQAGTLVPPPSWVTNAATITDDGTNKSVTLAATNSAQFFRLRRP